MDSDKFFWYNNFKEHMYFLYNSLNGVLKDEALDLYSELNINGYFFHFDELIKKIGNFKYKLLYLIQNENLDLSLILISHQIEEYEYFMKIFKNIKISFIEEFSFWNLNDMEHIQINIKHIKDKDLMIEANNLINKFRLLNNNAKNFISSSLSFAKETQQFHKKIRNSIKLNKSSIDIILISHIIEEGERGILIRNKSL